LSTKTEKRLEKIQKLLERLEKQSSKGTPLVVEGRNDIRSLHQLGITCKTIAAKTSGKSFLDVVGEIERTGKREVILLLDFDRQGKMWANRLARYLERMKITPNLVFWRRLKGLVGRDVKDIEGLASYLETLKDITLKS
jgi:2,5-diamino-6-(ribosylamino)-4(3H)-pyrimidinone 5'-phosphate reductase